MPSSRGAKRHPSSSRHLTSDASETSASRGWGPREPGSPQTEEKSPPFCGTAGTTGTRFSSAQQATCFRAPARNFFWGSFSAKTGVLRKQNPGFCAARAAIGRLLKRFSRFGRKNRQFLTARARIIFVVPQGIPVISALPPEIHHKRTKGLQQARGVPGVARPRTAPSTIRHKSQWNVTI